MIETKEMFIKKWTDVLVKKIEKQSPNLKPIQVLLLAEVAAEAKYESLYSLRV